MAFEPTAIASRQRYGAQAVGENGKTNREGHHENDQVLFGEVRSGPGQSGGQPEPVLGAWDRARVGKVIPRITTKLKVTGFSPVERTLRRRRIPLRVRNPAALAKSAHSVETTVPILKPNRIAQTSPRASPSRQGLARL